jgi:hypothetical protein
MYVHVPGRAPLVALQAAMKFTSSSKNKITPVCTSAADSSNGGVSGSGVDKGDDSGKQHLSGGFTRLMKLETDDDIRAFLMCRHVLRSFGRRFQARIIMNCSVIPPRMIVWSGSARPRCCCCCCCCCCSSFSSSSSSSSSSSYLRFSSRRRCQYFASLLPPSLSLAYTLHLGPIQSACHVIVCDCSTCLILRQVHLDMFFHHAFAGFRCFLALLLRHMDHHALQCAVPAAAAAATTAAAAAAANTITAAALQCRMNNAVQVQLTRQSAPIIRNHMRALWEHSQSRGDLIGTQFFRFSFILVSLQTSSILV